MLYIDIVNYNVGVEYRFRIFQGYFLFHCVRVDTLFGSVHKMDSFQFCFYSVSGVYNYWLFISTVV